MATPRPALLCETTGGGQEEGGLRLLRGGSSFLYVRLHPRKHAHTHTHSHTLNGCPVSYPHHGKWEGEHVRPTIFKERTAACGRASMWCESSKWRDEVGVRISAYKPK